MVWSMIAAYTFYLGSASSMAIWTGKVYVMPWALYLLPGLQLFILMAYNPKILQWFLPASLKLDPV